MRRRAFIAALGDAAAWPLMARTQERVRRVGVLSNPGADDAEMQSSAEFPNAGLLITASAPANVHRDLILRLADRHRLPAAYPYRYFVVAGGLACYGPDTIGHTVARRATWTVFLGARNQRTFRYRRQPSTSL